jgi:tRNA threonylcarbamoyladenosine modification (KEOPS) complex Cgi121 subunit
MASNFGSIQVRVFNSVNNASLIQELHHEELRCAVVDLNLVVSIFHLKSAAIKAMLSETQNTMKTKFVSTEFLYNLSSTKKINEGIKQYNVNNNSQLIGVLIFNGDVSDPMIRKIIDSIDGVEFDANDLTSEVYLTNEKLNKLQKHFKITQQELSISSIENAICTRLSMKEFL